MNPKSYKPKVPINLMKKTGVIVLLISILILGLSIASETDDITDSAEKLTQGVENFTEAVDLETGEVDVDKLNQLVEMPRTQFEQRIDKINLWLDENVEWLSFFFRTKPQLSWEFFMNLYLMLVGITWLILNSKRTIPIGGDFTPYIIGTGIFIIFLFTNFILLLSRLLLNLFDIVWNVLLPISFWVALLSTVVFLVLLFIAPNFVAKIITLIVKFIVRKKAEKSMKEGAQNEKLNQTLDKIESFYKGLQGRS